MRFTNLVAARNRLSTALGIRGGYRPLAAGVAPARHGANRSGGARRAFASVMEVARSERVKTCWACAHPAA